MTPAQTDTPRTKELASRYRGHQPSHREVSDWIELSADLESKLSQAVKVAGEALEACLKKGSKWHP